MIRKLNRFVLRHAATIGAIGGCLMFVLTLGGYMCALYIAGHFIAKYW